MSANFLRYLFSKRTLCPAGCAPMHSMRHGKGPMDALLHSCAPCTSHVSQMFVSVCLWKHHHFFLLLSWMLVEAPHMRHSPHFWCIICPAWIMSRYSYRLFIVSIYPLWFLPLFHKYCIIYPAHQKYRDCAKHMNQMTWLWSWLRTVQLGFICRALSFYFTKFKRFLQVLWMIF